MSSCYENCSNLAYSVSPGAQRGSLNPQVYKVASGFCESGGASHGCSGNPVFTTPDNRLFNSPRAQQQYLDIPPSDSSVWMGNVYDQKYVPRNYGQRYTGYRDITAGQIAYYIDPSTAPAFRHQIYSSDATTEIDVETTPMGKVEPAFYLVPDQDTHNNVSIDTFARDQLSFRNDSMSLEQRGHNKTLFQALG